MADWFTIIWLWVGLPGLLAAAPVVGLPLMPAGIGEHPAVVSGGGMVTEVSVEVVAKGESPEWIRVQIPAEAVPEPGVPLLLLPALALLVLRRRRRFPVTDRVAANG